MFGSLNPSQRLLITEAYGNFRCVSGASKYLRVFICIFLSSFCFSQDILDLYTDLRGQSPKNKDIVQSYSTGLSQYMYVS